MKNLTKLFFIVVSITLFSSCAIHSGYMNNSAALSQANFNYVQTGLSGTSTAIKILGIGGLNKQAMVDEAKDNMLMLDQLKSNQAIANVSVNWKSSFFLLVVSTKCTVTADIVEFK